MKSFIDGTESAGRSVRETLARAALAADAVAPALSWPGKGPAAFAAASGPAQTA